MRTKRWNNVRLFVPILLLALAALSAAPYGHRSFIPSTAPAAAPYNWTALLPAPPPSGAFHPPMAAPDICETENNVFQAGEKIVYKLYYNWNFVWLAAGEVTFQVNGLDEQYHITVRGKTYPSYEWFYAVDDKYESYLDKKTLLPEIHIKDVHEGGYTRFDRTVFDQIDHTAVSSRGANRNDLQDKYMDLDGCMHDLISIVYYARNLDPNAMTKGQEIPIKILMDQEIHPLALKYIGREERTKVKGVGFYDTQIFSPQLIAGEVFKEGDEMKIYVSNDRNKIPVLIESPVSVGSVKAVLKSYEGLKYPMTAEVE